MPFFPDITHRLLAARSLGKVNAGVQSNLDIGSSGPPAATGVTPGQAYPDRSAEPTVIVNSPYVEPDLPMPEPYVPPEWVYPGEPLNTASYPPTANLASPIDAGSYPPTSVIQPIYPGPGYTDPEVANAQAMALADWNAAGWTPNIHDPENAQGGALAARFGLMGIQGGGVDYRKRFK